MNPEQTKKSLLTIVKRLIKSQKLSAGAWISVSVLRTYIQNKNFNRKQISEKDIVILLQKYQNCFELRTLKIEFSKLETEFRIHPNYFKKPNQPKKPQTLEPSTPNSNAAKPKIVSASVKNFHRFYISSLTEIRNVLESNFNKAFTPESFLTKQEFTMLLAHFPNQRNYNLKLQFTNFLEPKPILIQKLDLLRSSASTT